VEVDYLAVLQGDGAVPFLAAPDDAAPAPKAGDAQLGGPWQTSVVHKLKG
jgi:hypothetical protein